MNVDKASQRLLSSRDEITNKHVDIKVTDVLIKFSEWEILI